MNNKYNQKHKKLGISLLVLIITIIVILILSGAVILSLVQNSPINQVNEATFKADLDAVKSDLSMYIANQYSSNKIYDPDKLNANELSVEYNGTSLPGKTIKDVITVLATTDKYNGQFEVVDGKLVYVGTDRTKKRWAQDISVDVLDADRLDAVITSTATLPVSAGTDVTCIIKYSSNASIDRINLVGKLELLDENNVSVVNQPVFTIGTPSGSTSDTLRTVNVTIKTDALTEGTYKLKLKPTSVYNIYDVTITKDIITDVLFEIDNTPPTNPIMLVDPTGWTNEDVTVTITYPSDSTSSEYSLDGNSWSEYTGDILVNTNNTTVYARATDVSGNQSGQSTITIANIDKDIPTVAYAPNGGGNLQTISTKVTVTDIGASNVKSDSLQYVWDIQNSVEPTTGWTSFINGSTIERVGDNTYYLWIKASDNAENTVINKSNAFGGDITPPVNPTMSASPTGLTNGNVTVTITYPADASIKEYSMNGTTWNVYTAPIVVTDNNTTVYARGTDIAGNQSGQSTLTIANIDKEAPVVNDILNGGAIYDDPTFSNGYNSTGIYNNLGNGLVTNTRTAISDSPVGSQYGLVIKSTGAVVPGYGGFYFATQTAANKIFTTRIIAKIPVGYNINWGSNAVGIDGAESYWLTSQAGTGNWQEYIFKVKCGSTGTFSTTNFYYLTGSVAPTPSSPLEWTVAYANVFEKDRWSPSNTVMFKATDNNGIVGYGINQSSTVQPTFTSCISTTTIVKSIENITTSGTYYIWIKDIVGNVANRAVVINNVDSVAPQISTNVRSVINTSFSNWSLSGGAYLNASGQLVLPSTGSQALSPYFQVDGNPWMHTLDATTSQSSPYFAPDGGVLMGSSYYDSSYVNVVSNNSYSGNGYAEKIVPGGVGHASWDGWNGYGPNVKYVRMQVLVDANYSNAPVTCYNPVFTTVQSVLSPSKKIIVTITENLSGIKTKKWLSGSKTINDFQSAGTTFDTEFTVTVNGTYTIYTEDIAGNKTVQQVVITQIG